MLKSGSKTNLQTVNDAHLKPGHGFEQHKHIDSEEIYYFLEGTGLMTVDDKEINVKPGDCFLVEAGENHGLKNITDGKLRFITIRIII